MNPNCYPDYQNNCILGIPNSILRYFGATPHHGTLPILDERLNRQFKNVVLLILDGLGAETLKTHAADGFLMRNCVAELGSVYPCTTTTALTTYETGLLPIEHGWLGWSTYFKELGRSVELFTGKQSGTQKVVDEFRVVQEAIQYKNLFQQIQEVDDSVAGCRVSPFGEYKTKSLEDICAYVEALCQKTGRRYIYAYHFQPDADMHFYGCGHERIKAEIVLFDRLLEQLAARVRDTLLIVTSDHGLTDVEELLVEDYPDVNACLRVVPTREARSLSLFVKPEFLDVFPGRWERHFADDFILMTAEEAVAQGLLGVGMEHPRIRDFLGDYVALATGNKMVWFRNDRGGSHGFRAAHAGLRTEEMIVPLVLIER